MNLSMVQSLVMGFISGLTEMLPICAEAHRALLRSFFGVDSQGALFTLMIHVACFVTLMMHCGPELRQLREANRQLKIPARRRTHHPRLSAANTLRLLRSAGVIVTAGSLLGLVLSSVADSFWKLALVLALNGALLFAPGMLRGGNKDARNMPRVDGLLMGLGAGLSALPGISPVGAAVSLGLMRGVDRRFALRFAQLLLLVGLGANICFDILAVVAGGLNIGMSGVLTALAGAACAAVGSWLGLKIVRAAVNGGWFSNFCYYSWGMAIVTMFLYLFA